MEDEKTLADCRLDILKIRSECLALAKLIGTVTDDLQGKIGVQYIEVMEGVTEFIRMILDKLIGVYRKIGEL